MKRMMMMVFMILLGFTLAVTLEGSSHKAGLLPGTLAGLLNVAAFPDAGRLWDANGDLMLSSVFHRFEGPVDVGNALGEKYNHWHVELVAFDAWPSEPAGEAALLEPKALAILKPPSAEPKPPKTKPKAPPSTMASAPGFNRPDLEFVNWVYRAQQGGTTEIHLYTAIASRRPVDPSTAPKDHDHILQWRFLTVRELPAPPALH